MQKYAQKLYKLLLNSFFLAGVAVCMLRNSSLRSRGGPSKRAYPNAYPTGYRRPESISSAQVRHFKVAAKLTLSYKDKNCYSQRIDWNRSERAKFEVVNFDSRQ